MLFGALYESFKYCAKITLPVSTCEVEIMSLIQAVGLILTQDQGGRLLRRSWDGDGKLRNVAQGCFTSLSTCVCV